MLEFCLVILFINPAIFEIIKMKYSHASCRGDTWGGGGGFAAIICRLIWFLIPRNSIVHYLKETVVLGLSRHVMSQIDQHGFIGVIL